MFMEVRGTNLLLTVSCLLLVIVWDYFAEAIKGYTINVELFSSAEEAHDRFEALLTSHAGKKSRKNNKAVVVQHSLTYAKDVLAKICKDPTITEVEVFLKRPSTAISAHEALKIRCSLLEHIWIFASQPNKTIRLYLYSSPASFRGILVPNIGAIVGSYIYTKGCTEDIDIQIFGHNTHAALVRHTHPDFRQLEDFFTHMRDQLVACSELFQQDEQGNWPQPDDF